ncbi:MAG: cytochrome P450 [Deltaproteobacteria bacterium]|nr:cytochrome P450 [Deltaproteobacteria bacterium]NND30884.1 cytochrome P450 [Myxococcales bacterium]MBT8464822.1 cytochrome P450 [Deltaproteobacteria bacterium]MBT8482075.1 cytochrome P450 [Deltaproteobacteria bacterium]NNK06448.1 cytochrome P450 [Myxococcales bacterium]
MNAEAAAQASSSSVPSRPIPRKEGHWFWGCALDLAADRTRFLIEGHAEYGDVFVSRALVRDLMFVRDPAVVNAINVTHWSDFYKPDYIKMMWKPFLGNGLVPNDGESWKRQHKLIMPGFHKKRVDAYAPTMVEFTERMIDRWKEGEQRDMRLELNALALEVVADTLFDIDIGEGDSETIRDALADISEILVTDADKMIPRPAWWPTAENRRKKRAIAKIEAIIRRVHQERLTHQHDRGDLFSHMVFAEDEQGRMSDKQLRDEAMTLIFAGHETTAHALTWTWYLLAKSPGKVAKMREELGRVASGRRVEVEDLPKLPYLEMVVKESLRLLPSVWAYARQAQRDLVIEGYEIKKGQTITISHIAMGRNPKYYDNPLEFRPERWTREFERSLPRGAYVPFAAGPRVCLGKQFAMMEMRMILATLIQRLEPNLSEGFEPDFVTELSMHPGERGMQADVRFCEAR